MHDAWPRPRLLETYGAETMAQIDELALRMIRIGNLLDHLLFHLSFD